MRRPAGDRMRIRIFPHRNGDGFQIAVNEWGLGLTFDKYDHACTLANTIANTARREEGEPVVIDYSECLK